MDFKEYQPKEGNWYKHQQLNPETLTPAEMAIGTAVIFVLCAAAAFCLAIGL